ncbi:MAG: hypothetical protein ACRD0Z_17140 [Acidimicrobiales bacterium]
MTAAGAVVHEVRIGGMPVRLRFAGSSLVPYVLPAFTHLRTKVVSEQPRLTVELWDGATTGIFPPGFVSDRDAPGRGEVREFDDAGVRAVFHSGVRPQDGAFRSVTIFDDRSFVARYFVVDPEETYWYERAAPLRAVLHWALSQPDRLLVHAGAIAAGNRSLLLAGPGGAGKSTSAVAAMLGGYDYLGDDYVLLDLADEHPMVHSLYATAKLGENAISLLPGLPEIFAGSPPLGAPKHVLDVSRCPPGRLGTSAQIVAVVVPRLCPGHNTTLRSASASVALQALAPSTIFQAPRRDGVALRPLAKLVRCVPAYVLDLGGAPADVAPVLGQLLNCTRGNGTATGNLTVRQIPNGV